MTFAQNKYEDRKINDVAITFEGADKDVSAAEQFRLIAKTALGETYSTVKVREAIDALYQSKKIVTAQVEATAVGNDNVNLRFIIKRKTQVERVDFKIGTPVGEPITEDELILKLNLINSGEMITKQNLDDNAEAIQVYLRERGYYKADVNYSPQSLGNAPKVPVTFQITPNAQSRIENFSINVKGFDDSKVRKLLKLQNGAFYSRESLVADEDKIRKTILKEGFLAPQLEEPQIVYDNDKNAISIELKGEVGAKVNVKVEVPNEKISEQTQETLLPIKREGTLDFSAIKEGERRLKNYFQEKGYFFAEVEEVCSVTPEFPKDEANPLQNNSAQLCEVLGGADLDSRQVNVNYVVNLNRRLVLKEIRIEGTKKITVPEIISVIDTQRASIIGLIPRLGYGRGYTSNEILNDDKNRIESIMRELGYRRASVRVKQGASVNGDNLIITFVVNEGILTTIDNVEIVGNKVFKDETLRKELPVIVGKNYSRARARNGAQKIAQFYAREGYFDADINFSIVDLPKEATATEEKVKIIYTIEKEGKKVFVNRILINGNERTRRESILRTIDVRQDNILLAKDIFSSEQNLYATDAFRRVEIKPEPAGETPNGDAQRDVIINLEEQKPRLLNYGGGYSTEFGVSGFFSIRHYNLFGKLQQGGARLSWSRLQQMVQFDFLNPRFLPDGKNRFAPLSLTLQYQRDSTVTRFFRSAFDQGTFGIVQRIDDKGNPINEFGARVTNPTLHRLTFTAETNRTISQQNRSLLFLRYRFEDVRLYDIDSLLIADLLRPDQKVRVSGFGATFVRDTRANCSRKSTLIELITKGEVGDPCRYNPSDPTRGSYVTLEYNVSARPLGANISFQKFSANYQGYYQIPKANNTVLAGRVILGLGNVLSKSNRFTGNLAIFNNSLPISERYFAGGSTTLRGFDYESAGPRVVVTPQGTFRNSKGEIVTLNPFTVPFGGNGLAIVNLEARVPLNETVQAVPFYDGGNVFNRVGDIFKPLQSATGDVLKDNLRATWTNTVGLGLRIKTPFGGAAAIDYGYLVNPPKFIVPQNVGPNAIFQPRRTQLHFRFAQTF
ncbi:MAG: BamA/TamA family outer membrane protein [Pyrinomonadaceae bacterium]|nr:BamA/TamA family outer membrane protein [Pyrinomonadaceae bacterium]